MQNAQLIIYMGIENNKSSHAEGTVRDEAKKCQKVKIGLSEDKYLFDLNQRK
jgi:hypothetical protein